MRMPGFRPTCAMMLRLILGSEPSRSISLPMQRLLQALVERGVAEIGERLAGRRRVEGPVAVVRHGARARGCLDFLFSVFHFYYFFCNIHERVNVSRRNIENAGAAPEEHAHGELGDVVDEDVVATLLALAEEHDFLALGGQTAKAE